MLESVSTDSRHYPQGRGGRFAEGGGRFTGMPRITLRGRYLTLKLRALLLGLRRLRAGRLPRRQETGKLRRIQEIEMADRREAMKEGLSMVLSLYLRSTLGIIFFPSLDKFGGAFEEPLVRLEDRTRPMRR